MRRRSAWAVVAAVWGMVAGCDGVAVDGNYLGEPLFEVAGSVRLVVTPQDLGRSELGPLRVGLFWSGAAQLSEGLAPGMLEQASETFGAFPARYAVTLYAPPAAALVTTRPGAQGRFAYAVLMAYVDVDGDGRWSQASEPLVGGAFERVVIYAPEGAHYPFFGTLGPGFHVLARHEAIELCEEPGEVEDHRELDPVSDPDTEVVVNLWQPMGALIDFDCDDNFPWIAQCPALSEVRAGCAVGGRLSGQVCAQCQGRLPPDGAGRVACDRWTRTCYRFAEAAACEAQRQVCVTGRLFEAGETCEAEVCRCHRDWQVCLEAGRGSVACDTERATCDADAGEDSH